MPADLADIDRTIALWRGERPPLTAFTAWKALGGKPWSEVTWRDVREMMALSEPRSHDLPGIPDLDLPGIRVTRDRT